MNINHEEQIAALNKAKEILQRADIATYSLLLRMNKKQYGVAEAIYCVLDTRKSANAEVARDKGLIAQKLLKNLSEEYDLPIETTSTGHPFVTKKAEPKN